MNKASAWKTLSHFWSDLPSSFRVDLDSFSSGSFLASLPWIRSSGVLRHDSLVYLFCRLCNDNENIRPDCIGLLKMLWLLKELSHLKRIIFKKSDRELSTKVASQTWLWTGSVSPLKAESRLLSSQDDWLLSLWFIKWCTEQSTLKTNWNVNSPSPAFTHTGTYSRFSSQTFLDSQKKT